MNEWIAVLPLVGVVVGATMQHLFSRAAESRKQLQLLQSQCYVDYLAAVTKAKHAVSADANRSAVAEMTDAKARMAVYGSADVIATLSRDLRKWEQCSKVRRHWKLSSRSSAQCDRKIVPQKLAT